MCLLSRNGVVVVVVVVRSSSSTGSNIIVIGKDNYFNGFSFNNFVSCNIAAHAFH